jgi:uncharacterized protein YggT (Ycf19 family)
MKWRQRKFEKNETFYGETTDPMLRGFTAPIGQSPLPRESSKRRLGRAIGAFFSYIIKKIRQLLALALAIVLLLLFARFLLHLFGLTHSQFAQWVLLLSAPLAAPFDNLLPKLPFDGYSIDISTLVAIVVFTVVVVFVNLFLKMLAPGDL